MKTTAITFISRILVVISIFTFTYPKDINACTRIVYQSKDGKAYTARTMDWSGNMQTNLWVFPRGMQRNGVAGSNSYTWTSKYGSVISSAYDFATADGMNEKGLSVNLLWLSASKFPDKDDVNKPMSLAVFPQFLLDSYATVQEAVSALHKQEFIVITSTLPGDNKPAGIHISLSDPAGDNAIIEFIDGEMVIHHDRKYNVLTNDPVFEEHLTIKKYWKNKNGKALPGTYSSSDRFVRASYYTSRLPEINNKHIALSSVFALIRGISVPKNEDQYPQTIWRTVMGHDTLIYHFESAENPYIMFWWILAK